MPTNTKAAPSVPQVRWEDVRETLNRKLGEGSSGQVWVASYFNSLIAVKVVRIDRTDGEPAGRAGGVCIYAATRSDAVKVVRFDRTRMSWSLLPCTAA